MTLLTIDQVAERLGVSRRTAHLLIEACIAANEAREQRLAAEHARRMPPLPDDVLRAAIATLPPLPPPEFFR